MSVMRTVGAVHDPTALVQLPTVTEPPEPPLVPPEDPPAPLVPLDPLVPLVPPRPPAPLVPPGFAEPPAHAPFGQVPPVAHPMVQVFPKPPDEAVSGAVSDPPHPVVVLAVQSKRTRPNFWTMTFLRKLRRAAPLRGVQ
jgi:hypothetical protein